MASTPKRGKSTSKKVKEKAKGEVATTPKGKEKAKEQKKETKVLRVTIGLVFAALALFTLVALISYIFTWSKDQSLSFHPELFDNDVLANNSGGKMGFLLGKQLISKFFGFGAFIIPVFFGAVSLFCLRIKKVNLLRILLVTLFGAIILSLFFAYIFSFTKYTSILGNGAGGEYGHFATMWLGGMIGRIGTGCVIFIAMFLWLSSLSKKVALWFDNLIYSISHPKKKANPAPEGVDGGENNIDEPAEGDGEGGSASSTEETDFKEDIETSKGEVKEVEAANGVVEVGGLFDNDDTWRDLGPVDDIGKAANRDESSDEVGAKEELPDNEDNGVKFEVEKSDTDFFPDLSEDEKKHLFDPRLDLPSYQQPPLSLLEDYRDKWYEVSLDELEKNKNNIVNALANYKIKVEGIVAKMGPTVTLYKIHLAEGIRIAQVKRLEEDIALSLGAKGVRVITLLDAVGIEVANEKPSVVALKSVMSSQKYKEAKLKLPLAMGITVTNEPFFLDLAKMPHLLIAGATGMGKSVGLNSIIASLIYAKHPSELKIVMVDPKKVELSLYSKLEKHFLAKMPDEDEAIITDTKKVVNTMKSLCIEMENRYDLLKEADVRQIDEYNELFLSRKLNPAKGHTFMPYIVVIIDEFADLLMTAGREIEEPIARLAQKARAIGIHLVIATQRPTTDIITGTIKANFNSRIAFKVNASVDSKTILDEPGANRLIGRGDMLVKAAGYDMTRVQCALIDTDEIKRITQFINEQRGYDRTFPLPEYVDENDNEGIGDVDLRKRDKLFEEAAKLVVQYQQGSTSLIQRKLNLGYARAGRIIDQLEQAGIVGPFGGSKARTVLVTDFDSLDRILESLDHL